jgi:hypothetical protein
MGVKKTEVAGTTFVEILLALGISCMAAAGAIGMLSTADFQFAKSRVERLLGMQVRSFHERLAGMPYASLVEHIPRGRSVSDFSEEGYLLNSATPQFPWKMEVHLERANQNTMNENITVQVTFSWQEPAPGFPRTENLTRTLSCPSFHRRRF